MDGIHAAVRGWVWPWPGQSGSSSPGRQLPGCFSVAGEHVALLPSQGQLRGVSGCAGAAPTLRAFHLGSLGSAGGHGGFVNWRQSPLRIQGKGLLVNKRQGAGTKEGHV